MWLFGGEGGRPAQDGGDANSMPKSVESVRAENEALKRELAALRRGAHEPLLAPPKALPLPAPELLVPPPSNPTAVASPLVRTHGGDRELGFIYEQDRGVLRAELGAEKAELLRARTEAASARFARNILRTMVSRLIEKRRAMHGELRHMEHERAALNVQLSLLKHKARSSEEAARQRPARQTHIIFTNASIQHEVCQS